MLFVQSASKRTDALFLAMRPYHLIVFVLVFSGACQQPQSVLVGSTDGLIPLPASLVLTVPSEGLFVPSSQWNWQVDESWSDQVEFWKTWFPGQSDKKGVAIQLQRIEGEVLEGYQLRIDPQWGVWIGASDSIGVFRALTTLRQILPVELDLGAVERDLWLPALEINDAPRFEHRGLLLDCCRHFMEPEFVKKSIDLLALHKMNVLHWHLTEDQGWRVPIMAYPKLTTVGAWREEKNGGTHGGFYTKDDIRQIVAYASDRGVTVIPEIELPGHSRAAIAAYPWLSCTGDTLPVPNDWGVFKDIYCAGQDTTFRFLESVLDEVMELFPSQYIHIGGDEAPKVRWDACPKCQRRMNAEGLHDSHELQSWFINRIGKYLKENGRKLIGWDEILEGGLPEGATVQSWRGIEGGVAAVAAGKNAIMSPTSHCYFDYPLSATDMEEVYQFEPAPNDLKGEGRILGGECNMWTEHAPQEVVESKIFPRILAMAEVLWSPGNLRDFGGFQRRKEQHDLRLQAWGVDSGLESEPLETVWGKGNNAFRVEVQVNAALKGIEGEVTFTPYSALEETSSHELGSSIQVTGEGVLQARLTRYGSPLRDEVRLPVAGHIGVHSEAIIGHELSPYYPGGGAKGLVDGRLGSLDFRDGCWQAVAMENMSLTLAFPQAIQLDSLSIQCYRYQDAWIFLPESLVFEWSMDGVEWESDAVKIKSLTGVGSLEPTDAQDIVRVSHSVAQRARFVRLVALNSGPCPDWHDAASSPSWMFLDELVVHGK